MRFAGSESWSVSIGMWDLSLGCALWFRAAERIEVPADELVTGPPDIDPLPEPSLSDGTGLTEGWLWWWRTLLTQAPLTTPPSMAAANRFGPPGFDGLAGYPALRDVVRARWAEANAWHSARQRASIETFHPTRGQVRGREGAVVRAVEAEIGHQAAPFSVHIIVLPVHDQRIRSVGHATFLVPERVYAGSTYEKWLHDLVRALA